jgi:hypothetical protein
VSACHRVRYYAVGVYRGNGLSAATRLESSFETVAASAGTSTFVGVTIVAAISTISEAVLAVIRLATYLRDPFRGLRRLHKPLLGHISMYRIPTTGATTRDLPQGADPRAWSWRAARPRT